jgi:hypothetical protein
MAELPQEWRDAVGRVRSDSATARLLAVLPTTPVFSVAELEERVGGATSAVYRAVDVLVEAAVLRPLTDRRRNQVWGVGDLLDELDDLNVRIGAAARADV